MFRAVKEGCKEFLKTLSFEPVGSQVVFLQRSGRHFLYQQDVFPKFFPIKIVDGVLLIGIAQMK